MRCRIRIVFEVRCWLFRGSSAGELIPELARCSLQQLIELELAALLGAGGLSGGAPLGPCLIAGRDTPTP